jgi:hypothetical protein
MLFQREATSAFNFSSDKYKNLACYVISGFLLSGNEVGAVLGYSAALIGG